MWIFPDKDKDLQDYLKSKLSLIQIFPKGAIDNSYIVIRCVKKSDTKRAYEAHFDNYEKTWVVPLKMPNKKPDGALYAWENARKTPTNLISHIATKILFQNRVARLLYKTMLKNKFKEVTIRPGDIGHFNGFTTLHYNTNVCEERRSILIHWNKPFQGTKTVDIIEKYSQYNANNNK